MAERTDLQGPGCGHVPDLGFSDELAHERMRIIAMTDKMADLLERIEPGSRLRFYAIVLDLCPVHATDEQVIAALLDLRQRAHTLVPPETFN